jgi:hypothetical protein
VRSWLPISAPVIVFLSCVSCTNSCRLLLQVLIRILPLEDCILPEADKRKIGEWWFCSAQ